MTSPAERRIADLVALARSIVTYHGDAIKNAGIDALYGRFLKPGDLAIDVGSHVGDRVASFRRLGARVVALEPQPGPSSIIAQIFAGDRDVAVLREAAGRRPGKVTLHVNSRNPTASTASPTFIAAAAEAAGWEAQVWDRALDVPVTTLDAIMARHGRPAFVKIDVEGFEAEVLGGLSSAVPALSFAFTTIQRDVALASLERLAALGAYRFDVALGESQRLAFERWVGLSEMAAHLASLPHEANSGDVYAALEG